jgi:glycosyltransferase involved in cell wall biosynthesis
MDYTRLVWSTAPGPQFRGLVGWLSAQTRGAGASHSAVKPPTMLTAEFTMKVQPPAPVYLIGIPDTGHPATFRYLGWRRYIQTRFLAPPRKTRFFKGIWGWRLDNAISALAPRPYYPLSLLLMETVVGLHMLRRRDAIYHAVKADVDLLFLPRIARFTRNHLVGTFHEPPDLQKYWKIDRWVPNYLGAAIVLSESLRSYFNDLLPADRVFLVPHGVDTAFFRPADCPETRPVCISVGSHLRDADTLMQAMALVWRENPQVRLIIVGARRSNDPNRPPDFDDERVEFRDYVSDRELLAAYHAASMAVLSLQDAVANNALLEAMACGLPIVATDVGGVREYLGEDAGEMCTPGDPVALAAGILRIAAEPSNASVMSAKGRERALRFDHCLIADQMRQVYERVRSMGPR